MLVNFDCSALWVRDAEPLKAALSLTPEFLRAKGNMLDYKVPHKRTCALYYKMPDDSSVMARLYSWMQPAIMADISLIGRIPLPGCLCATQLHATIRTWDASSSCIRLMPSCAQRRTGSCRWAGASGR